tara:strand:- start:45 stop:374 length:330 start_codon:yes stop_codon:yes gene_type:complete
MFVARFLLIACFFSFTFCGNITESYKVEGMHCQYGCANKVKSLMSELEGMKKCEVDFESSTMIVEYDDSKVTSELILSTMSDNTTFKSAKIEDKKTKKSIWNKIKKLFG